MNKVDQTFRAVFTALLQMALTNILFFLPVFIVLSFRPGLPLHEMFLMYSTANIALGGAILLPHINKLINRH